MALEASGLVRVCVRVCVCVCACIGWWVIMGGVDMWLGRYVAVVSLVCPEPRSPQWKQTPYEGFTPLLPLGFFFFRSEPEKKHVLFTTRRTRNDPE